MIQRNDGGPAYACAATLYPDGSIKDCGSEGMSLRDYFAAKALAALIAEPQWGDGRTSTLSQVYGGNVSIGMDIEHVFAKVSYAMADAMLAARERT